MAQQQSIDFNNALRSLDSELATIIAAQPSLISLATAVSTGGIILPSRTPVTQNKHEWSELLLSPELGEVNGTLTSSATTLTLVSGTGFLADMILAFEGSDEVVKVTAVSTNDLTIVRGYGGSTAAAITTGWVAKVISRPRPEGSDPDPNANSVPTVNYNYTEIFDDTYKVSGTAMNTALGGVMDSLINQNAYQSMVKVSRRINNAAIFGRRVGRSASEKGTMGGILQLVTNRVNAAGVALTQTILNNGIETIFKNGGAPTAIVCNTNQARRITAFHANQMFVLRADNTVGSSVQQFQGDLPMGTVSTIVVDPNFPKTKVGLLDTSKIYLDAYQGRALAEIDATLPGSDAIARRLIGEYTLELLNGGQAHAIIDNLLE